MLEYNGREVTALRYNGTQVERLIYNGQNAWAQRYLLQVSSSQGVSPISIRRVAQSYEPSAPTGVITTMPQYSGTSIYWGDQIEIDADSATPTVSTHRFSDYAYDSTLGPSGYVYTTTITYNIGTGASNIRCTNYSPCSYYDAVGTGPEFTYSGSYLTVTLYADNSGDYTWADFSWEGAGYYLTREYPYQLTVSGVTSVDIEALSNSVWASNNTPDVSVSIQETTAGDKFTANIVISNETQFEVKLSGSVDICGAVTVWNGNGIPLMPGEGYEVNVYGMQEQGVRVNMKFTHFQAGDGVALVQNYGQYSNTRSDSGTVSVTEGTHS